MKALVLRAYNQFVYEDVPVPEIGSDDVLVRVKAAGICGSDVHGMDGSTGRRQPPIIMGHEAAGVIAEIGADVVGWSLGDRVTFDSTAYCGRCAFCKLGRMNLCENRRVLGVSCDEYRCDGAFAEYVVMPHHILYRLPEGLSFEEAALVEPLSIAVHAVNRTPMGLNDSVAVIGVGMIGLLVVQALRVAGYGRIIAVDIAQEKLDLACELGADIALKADTCDVENEVSQATSGKGADHAFEVVGSKSTIATAVRSTRKGGMVTLVGNASPTVDLPLQIAVTRELSLLGSCASCGEYGACLELIAQKRINVQALISQVAPLEEGDAWFRRLYNKERGLMKVILVP